MTRDMNSRGATVFIVTTTTFCLATVFVCARLISRLGLLRKHTVDDWVMLLAWFLAFGLSFSIDYGTSRGLGKHDADIPNAWLPSLRRAEYAFTVLYNPALMATKTSILIFYLRMARNTQRVLRIASYIALAVVVVSGIVLTFLNIFQCNPVNSAWDITQNHENCMSIVTLFTCSAPANIITDLAILVLPIPVLTGMRLPQRQKTILVITFALGIFVTIVDIVRIYYLQQAVDTQAEVLAQATLGTGLDFAWNVSTAFMWSAVEVNVGIICACVPTLKPLIKKILPSMITDRVSGSTTHEDKEASFSSQLPASERRGSIALDVRHMPAASLRENQEHEIDSMQFLTTAGIEPPTVRTRTRQEEQIDALDFLTTPAGMESGAWQHPRRSVQPAGPGTVRSASGQPTTNDDPIGMVEFLQGSQTEMIGRTNTQTTQTTENTIYFGFVKIKRPKSMMKTKGVESLKYCTAVTILFFLWGFSYGLLNTLNGEISMIAGYSTAQTLGLTVAYFGAYFVGAMTVGQWVLIHSGFKATFIVGLCIYGTGTLMFWPSAVLTSLTGFILSNLVVGFGLSVLETAANPFLTLCGPPEYAEFRLCIAQGVQGCGSFLSNLLAEKVFFQKVVIEPSLLDVQWTYLAVALFTVCLALFFYYMPLPEACDSDLQQQTEELLGSQIHNTIFSPRLNIVTVTLVAAVAAQFLYVSNQEGHSIWFGQVMTETEPASGLSLSLNNYILLGHGLFALSRFIAGGLCLIMPPRIILLFSFAGCLLFSVLMVVLDVNATALSIPAMFLFFFEGPIWPLIYAIGLRGLGSGTKRGTAWITAAASGGASFPFVMYAVQKDDGKSAAYSYCVVATVNAVGILYPLYLCLFPSVKALVDPVEPASSDLYGNESRRPSQATERSGAEAPLRRASRRLSIIYEKIKSPMSKRASCGSGSGSEGRWVEHREGASVETDGPIPIA